MPHDNTHTQTHTPPMYQPKFFFVSVSVHRKCLWFSLFPSHDTKYLVMQKLLELSVCLFSCFGWLDCSAFFLPSRRKMITLSRNIYGMLVVVVTTIFFCNKAIDVGVSYSIIGNDSQVTKVHEPCACECV